MKLLCKLILLFTVLFSGRCRKENKHPPDTLPPVTQSGANTFGCKVDDEVWVPYYKCGGTSNPCGEVFSDIYPLNLQTKLPIQINISIGKRNKDNSQAYFQINTPTNSGIFSLGDKIDSVRIKFVKPGSIEFIEIPGMDTNNHFIITKLDTTEKIISGTFETVLYASATDSVKISEGRFDLKFNVCKCSN